MITMKGLIKNSARRLGYELSSSAMAHKAGLAPDISALIRMVKPQTVFDVGANTGQFRDFLRRDAGYAGDIHSFEPIPELALALHERAQHDAHWSVSACALGAARDCLTLNVSEGTDFSSFLKLSQDTLALFSRSVSRRTVEVPVISLADFIAEHHPKTPFFLKLDTQGFDLQVAKGAEPVMQDCAALLCEISVIALYEGQPTWQEMLSYLQDQGFDLVSLYPVNRTKSMQVIEFDCLMINRRFAAPNH